MRLLLASLWLAFIFLLGVSSAVAQSPCTPPPFSLTPNPENIFTPSQENDLGDAMAQHVQGALRIIEEDAVVGRLQAIGNRLVKHLPPTGLQIQFVIIDLPVANAFAGPGGRIYISRKLIALARSDDELAGVLGHELGHTLTRESSLEVSRLLRRVLSVTSVIDRKDIFDKYHQLIENIARKPGALRRSDRHEQREQVAADLVAVYAVALAGFNPEAIVAFWDRLAETKGKTGSWLSDFFGTTPPESRRLREMLLAVSKLPPACRDSAPSDSTAEFQAWQTIVANYSGLGRKESLPALISRRPLDPPLGNVLNHLRFSPDGNHVLAQDDSSIYVLSRDPFEFLFRIDAPEGKPASFTPDSKSIVFSNAALRVEKWNVAEETREAVHEVYRRDGCLQFLLSPCGQTLACITPDFHLNLVDVSTSTVTFEKKNFVQPDPFLAFIWMLARILETPVNYVNWTFSPDARYFVVSQSSSSLAFDLTARAPISLPGSIKKLLPVSFTFLGPDRFVGVNSSNYKKSALVRFPTGEVLSTFELGRQSISSPTRGDFVLLRPIQDFEVGAYSLTAQRIIFANRNTGFDIFDNITVSERKDGELGLYSTADNKPLARLALPRGPLGRIRAVAMSPSLDHLAVSERNRGAVWNLSTGERIFHTRGFRGAYFDATGVLFADFPEYEKTDRYVGRLDATNRDSQEFWSLKEMNARQHGRFVVVSKPRKPQGPPGTDVSLEILDVTSGKILWSESFPKEAPRVFTDPQQDHIVFSWPLSSAAAKLELKQNHELNRRVASMKEKEGDYYLRVVNALTGATLGALLLETGKGSFRINDIFSVGNTLVISDSENRALLYALADGAQKGRLFGTRTWASESAGVLIVEPEIGKLAIHDLNSLDHQQTLVFSSPVSVVRFSTDGNQLFVLTTSQVAHKFDLKKLKQPTSAASK